MKEWAAYSWRILTRLALELDLFLTSVKPRVRMARVSRPKRLLYVAASSMPYHVSGYTIRTQLVVRALIRAGLEVSVVTRTGYPWDRKDRLVEPQDGQTEVDGQVYQHMRYPEKQLPVLFYVLKAAGKVEKAALAEEASVIQAASNHVNALPALLAARRLGRSFHYEMRGLWELTRASRQPGYEKTQGYRQGLELEGMVARRADRVLVISEQLGLFIQKRWNIPSERLLLLPNCADPALRPADQEEVELNTIGYAGSLISYEGLDTLIEAVAMLRNRGLIVKVRLAGEGEARSELENQVNQLELTEQVKFFGLVTPDEARDILRRCSLVCIPRRPFQVCSLVPPIKLVEAMTLGKPLLVPDLPIFRDELGDSGGGLFFESGNPDSLAKAISLAINRPEDLALMGRLARYYALEQRSWSRFTAKLADPVEDQLAGWKGVNL